MGEVIQLRQNQQTETLLDFLRRKGAATTYEVANRFGLSMQHAFTELSDLRRAGVLASAPTKNRNGAVRMNEWRIASET